MKKKLFLMVILLVEAILTLIIVLKGVKENQDVKKKAAETSVKIYFEPSYLQIKEGGDFEAVLWLDPDNFPVVGADVKLKFDPQYLEVVEWLSGSDNFFYPETGRRTDNQSGEIVWTALSFDGINNLLPPLQTVTQVGRVRILARREGQTIIEPIFNHGETTDSNVAGENSSQDLLSSMNTLNIDIISANPPPLSSTSTPTPAPTPIPTPIPTLIPTLIPTPTPTSTLTLTPAFYSISTDTSGDTDMGETALPIVRDKFHSTWLKRIITFFTKWLCYILPAEC